MYEIRLLYPGHCGHMRFAQCELREAIALLRLLWASALAMTIFFMHLL